MKFARVIIAALPLSATALVALAGDEPIAWWKFDETGGSTAADSAGGFTGSLAGTASFTSGISGNAVDIGNGWVNMGNVLALTGTSFEAMGPQLKGPLVLAFSKDDPGAAARVMKDFAKGNDKLVPVLVGLGGQVLPGAELEKVASLPTREQALAMLLGALKAPLQKLAATLSAPQSKLARTMAALRDKQQAA